MEAGKANGRALAYPGPLLSGDIFGTVYDFSTISILWFAGSSACWLAEHCSALLAAYGMAPEWAARQGLWVVGLHGYLSYRDNSLS